MPKLGEKPTEPPPEETKPYLWFDGKWVLLATDTADGVSESLDVHPKVVVNKRLNSQPKADERSWQWWESRYSDDQPRDDHGRWTSEGGDSQSGLLSQPKLAIHDLGTPSELSGAQRDEMQSSVDHAIDLHPELLNGEHPLTAVEFTSGIKPGTDKVRDEMVEEDSAQALTQIRTDTPMRILVNDTGLWEPVDHQSAGEVMTHELGHAYFAEHGTSDPILAGALLEKNEIMPDDVVAATGNMYGATDPREAMAELYRQSETANGLPPEVASHYASMIAEVDKMPYSTFPPDESGHHAPRPEMLKANSPLLPAAYESAKKNLNANKWIATSPFMDELAGETRELRYSDDQPRDDHGRWTSEGSDTSAGGTDNTTELLKDIGYPDVNKADATWARSATPVGSPEKDSILRYQKESTDLNSTLRSGKELTPELREECDRLDHAIAEQAPSTQETVLYRGIGAGKVGLPGTTPPAYGEMPKGTNVADPGYVSVTTDRNLAETWAAERSGQEVLEVHVPAGTQGIDVNVHTESFLDQREVILPRAGTFEILGHGENTTIVAYHPPPHAIG